MTGHVLLTYQFIQKMFTLRYGIFIIISAGLLYTTNATTSVERVSATQVYGPDYKLLNLPRESVLSGASLCSPRLLRNQTQPTGRHAVVKISTFLKLHFSKIDFFIPRSHENTQNRHIEHENRLNIYENMNQYKNIEIIVTWQECLYNSWKYISPFEHIYSANIFHWYDSTFLYRKRNNNTCYLRIMHNTNNSIAESSKRDSQWTMAV